MPYKILRLLIILFLISPLAQQACIEIPKTNGGGNKKHPRYQNEHEKLIDEYFSILDKILILALDHNKMKKLKTSDYKNLKTIHTNGGYKTWYENQKSIQKSSNELTEEDNIEYQRITNILNNPKELKKFVVNVKSFIENANKTQKPTK